MVNLEFVPEGEAEVMLNWLSDNKLEYFSVSNENFLSYLEGNL